MKHITWILIVMIASVALAQEKTEPSRGQAVDALTDLMQREPRAIAVFLVGTAAKEDATGSAHLTVVHNLLELTQKVSLAETREKLSESDRAIISSQVPSAVFSKQAVLPAEIKDATAPLKGVTSDKK